ncbi:ABC transporter permease [Pelagibacteraceae bacterium]|jgi:ribose transport system permease protein|nr:ABC transporter permease [Pelagibacteraceae bacterium]
MSNLSNFNSLMKQSWSGVAVLSVFYIVIVIALSLMSPWFFSFNNAMNIGINMSYIGLMAAAGTPLIIAGGLDLSVAAVAGLTGVLITIFFGWIDNIWLAVAMSLFVGAFIGAFNGFLATVLKFNPLIATLGTMSIITGFSLVLTGGLTKSMMLPEFNYIGVGRIFNVPIPLIIMIVVMFLLWLLMSKTKFGRFLYASGNNPDASLLLGVPVVKVQFYLYVLSGLSGAIAGVLLTAMLGAAAPNAAGSHLLTIIAAIILGGTSLYGGIGSVWGTLFAVLILGTINNGLTLMNVSSSWQEVAKGTVLILAVGLDQWRMRA